MKPDRVELATFWDRSELAAKEKCSAVALCAYFRKAVNYNLLGLDASTAKGNLGL